MTPSTLFKWLRQTSPSQPDRRTSRRFTPVVPESRLEDRISLSSFGNFAAGACQCQVGDVNNSGGNTVTPAQITPVVPVSRLEDRISLSSLGNFAAGACQCHVGDVNNSGGNTVTAVTLAQMKMNPE